MTGTSRIPRSEVDGGFFSWPTSTVYFSTYNERFVAGDFTRRQGFIATFLIVGNRGFRERHISEFQRDKTR